MPKIKVVVDAIASEPDRSGHTYTAARFYDTETGATLEVTGMGASNARAACLKMGHPHGEYLVIESTITRRQFKAGGLDRWPYFDIEGTARAFGNTVVLKGINGN